MSPRRGRTMGGRSVGTSRSLWKFLMIAFIASTTLCRSQWSLMSIRNVSDYILQNEEAVMDNGTMDNSPLQNALVESKRATTRQPARSKAATTAEQRQLFNKNPVTRTFNFRDGPNATTLPNDDDNDSEPAVHSQDNNVQNSSHAPGNANTGGGPPPMAVFYNIFIPPNGEESVLNIINEQLLQLGVSEFVQRGNVSLYYVTIGDFIDPRCFMDLNCERHNLVCHHLKHYERGNEEITLQRLYEFCSNKGPFKDQPSHRDHRVIYMHSKGSYHGNETQTFSQASWRWHMTKAVAHDWCVHPPLDPSAPDCDICGLIALPWPHLHFAGNFFNAKCSYVRQLIAPKKFANRTEHLYQQIMQYKQQDKLITRLLPDSDHHFGRGRFAMEHWLGSHPDVTTCDLSPVPRVEPWQWMVRQRTPYRRPFKNFNFAMFPRRPVWDHWSYYYRNPAIDEMTRTKTLRMREYYLLAGNLLRWIELYDKVPSPQSWVWQWFPDGQEWLRLVLQYGAKQAVDQVTSQYAAAAAVK